MHVAVGVVLGLAIAVAGSAVRRKHGGSQSNLGPVDRACLERAKLQTLRAQISSHFVYNALAAVASDIRTDPDEARELLVELAEFTRYAVRGDRLYVTLSEELECVGRYLRLERARFGDRLQVRVEVDPEVLRTPLPVLSLQPLVENAVRHGVEQGHGVGHVEILGTDIGQCVELRVSDDGAGIESERARAALDGDGEGIGLANVQLRLRTSFGEDYRLRFEPDAGAGTTVVMTVPKAGNGVGSL